MADVVSVNVPMVDVRLEGQGRDARLVGYVTQSWFRYLVNSGPEGFGTGTGVLHGNPSGAPTWGPVDLTADVTGDLPVSHGGLGGFTRTAGGILYFPDANTVASSPQLAQNSLVVGGGAGGAPSTPLGLGSTSWVLHGNAGGVGSWGPVRLNFDVTGVLPIANGGTGATSGTGTGPPVFAVNASMSGTTIGNPQLTAGQWFQPFMAGQLLFASFGVNLLSQIGLNDSVTTTINTGPAALCTETLPMIWACYDHTLGGMAFGVADLFGGVNVIFNGLTTVAFSYSGGIQATVTGAPFTRTFRMALISLGHS